MKEYVNKLKNELSEKDEQISFLEKMIISLNEDVRSANEQACYYMCERNKLIKNLEV